MENKINVFQIDSASKFLAFIKQERRSNGCLSCRCVAKLNQVSKDAIIRGGDLACGKLAEKLVEHGFSGGDLARDGFPPEAVILSLEYYAYESQQAKSDSAKHLLRVLGAAALFKLLSNSEKQDDSEALGVNLVSADLLHKLAVKVDNMERKIDMLLPAAQMFQKIEPALTLLDELQPLLEAVSKELEKNPDQARLTLRQLLKREGLLDRVTIGERRSIGRSLSGFLKPIMDSFNWHGKPRRYPESALPIVQKLIYSNIIK